VTDDKSFRLHSRTGPEVPPDVAEGPAVVDEPTQLLAYVERRPPVAARAVIVYERAPRRPWRLWAFTGGLVALTLGVVLGQTVAYQPPARSDSRPTPVDVITPATVPAGPVVPVSEPLGAARSQILEVAGSATRLNIRSADLGQTLYTITALDGSAAPRMVKTSRGPRLALQPTGARGTVGATILLTTRVRWTLHLTGGVTEQEIDMRSGGLAGIALAGGTRATLLLPRPAGTQRLTVTGPIGDLNLRTPPGTALRLRLAAGAGQVTVDGKATKTPRPGTTLTSGKFATAKNRYDITTAAGASVVHADHP